MRDDKDPGTLELETRRPGRPSILHSGPMSDAERARAYRRRRREEAMAGGDLTQISTTVLLDRIRRAITFHHAPATVGRMVAELSRRYPDTMPRTLADRYRLELED